MDKRDRIVRRIARDLRDGDYVNLGIGMPTLVANCLPPGIEITLHSENGMLGVGPYPTDAEIDADLINAGKETVTELPGTSYFSSADSFAMVAGAKRVVIAMEHTTKDGGHKILPKCSLPLTGMKVVNQIVTELAVIDVTPKGLVLKEIASDTTLDAVLKATGAKLTVAGPLGTF